MYWTNSLRNQTRAQSVVTDSYITYICLPACLPAFQRIICRLWNKEPLAYTRYSTDIISRAHSSQPLGEKSHLFSSSEKSISQRTVYIWSLTFHSLGKSRQPRIHICLQHLPNRMQLLWEHFFIDDYSYRCGICTKGFIQSEEWVLICRGIFLCFFPVKVLVANEKEWRQQPVCAV